MKYLKPMKILGIFAFAFFANFATLAQNTTSARPISIEIFGSYGIASDWARSWSQTNTTNDPATYGPIPGQKGIGFGANFGYEILTNLAAVIGYNFQSLSTKVDFYSTTTMRNYEISMTTHFLNIGARPMVNALGGQFYAGAGFLLSLPTNYKMIETTSSLNRTISDEGKLNLSGGYYAELGYKYSVTEQVSIGLGLRINVMNVSNKGQDWTSANSLTGVTTTKKYSDSIAAGCSTGTTTCNAPETYSLTNTQFQLVAGLRL